MIVLDLSILNQKGTPMFYSDIFANRPSFGIVGRVFISTDTAQIFRDTGTSWVLLADGTGVTTNIYNSDGTLTGNRIVNTNGFELDFQGTNVIKFSPKVLINGATDIQGALQINTYNGGILLNTDNANFGITFNNTSSSNKKWDISSFDNTLNFNESNAGITAMTLFPGGSIAVGNTTQELSAKFNVDSQTQGFLTPRMSLAQRTAISSPAVGLIVYQTDAPEGLYQHLSTGWQQVSLDTNIYNSDGTLSANRTIYSAGNNLRFEGGANTLRFRLSADNNIPRILSFATADVARWALRVDGNETGLNTGGNFAIRRYNDAGTFVDSPISINREFGFISMNNTMIPTASSSYYLINANNSASVPAGITFNNGGGAGVAFFQNNTTFNGNATFQQDTSSGTTTHRNVITFPNAGTTITINQFPGATRAMAPIHTGNAMLNSQSGTISHLAGIFIDKPVRVFTGTTTQVNNYYGVLINPSDAAVALTYINRWGVYQEGANDPNYFAGKLLVGTSVIGTEALKVNGAATFSSSVTATTAKFLSGSSSTIALIVGGAGGSGTTQQGELRFGDAGVVYKIQGGQDYSAMNFVIGSTNVLSLASNGAATLSSSVTATSLIKSGGTSSQYLCADGSTNSDVLTISIVEKAYKELGSNFKGTNAVTGTYLSGLTTTTPNQQLNLLAYYFNENTTITNFNYYLAGAGNFTGNNFNGFAIYSFNQNGTITLIQTSVNDQNLFKGTIGWRTANLIAPVNITKGIYFIAQLVNWSAAVTPPTLPYQQQQSIASSGYGLPNNIKTLSAIAAQTTFPSTIDFTTATLVNGISFNIITS